MPKNTIADLPYNPDKISEVEKGKFIDDLMNVHSRKVYLLAYSYVKDKGLAEDIAQEVFIKCYKSSIILEGIHRLRAGFIELPLIPLRIF